MLCPNETMLKSTVYQRLQSTDALLYVAKQVDRIETFCHEQTAPLSMKSSDINALHYQDLLRQLKLIREGMNKK